MLSASSRVNDTVTKLAEYASMGLPWYWVLDPAARTLCVWDLRSPGGPSAMFGPDLTAVTVGGSQCDLDLAVIL